MTYRSSSWSIGVASTVVVGAVVVACGFEAVGTDCGALDRAGCPPTLVAQPASSAAAAHAAARAVNLVGVIVGLRCLKGQPGIGDHSDVLPLSRRGLSRRLATRRAPPPVHPPYGMV